MSRTEEKLQTVERRLELIEQDRIDQGRHLLRGSVALAHTYTRGLCMCDTAQRVIAGKGSSLVQAAQSSRATPAVQALEYTPPPSFMQSPAATPTIGSPGCRSSAAIGQLWLT